jgi:hypothetical protein
VSLWPLDQIVHDTQYYVRDAVIDYVTAQGIVSPATRPATSCRERHHPSPSLPKPEHGPASGPRQPGPISA